jgi:hypothetical protein
LGFSGTATYFREIFGLATTASIQAIANGKSAVWEVAKSIGFGLGSVGLGFTLAQALPPALNWLLGQ